LVPLFSKSGVFLYQPKPLLPRIARANRRVVDNQAVFAGVAQERVLQRRASAPRLLYGFLTSSA
jgi:hypothetical protein